MVLTSPLLSVSLLIILKFLMPLMYSYILWPLMYSDILWKGFAYKSVDNMDSVIYYVSII
jgi:hypothetical protein